MNKKRAFAILEVIITITLITLISSYCISFKFMQNTKEKTRVDNFVSDIRYVRNMNINGKKSEIIINKNKNTYTIKIGKQENTKSFGKDLEILYYTFHKIQFKDNYTKGNTIKLKGKKKIYIITIACITGRVKCEK